MRISENYLKTLEPYLAELGLLIYSWNHLHVSLTQLFLTDAHGFLDSKTYDLLVAIWNAVPNERSQRHILRQATSVRFSKDDPVLGEIMWILKMADILGRNRDDAAHLPTTISYTPPGPTIFTAQNLHRHPIAQQMSGKDMFKEFRLYRERIDVVGRHAQDIWQYLTIPRPPPPPLPQRPVWPTRPQSSADKASQEPSRPRARKRQRRSSPA